MWAPGLLSNKITFVRLTSQQQNNQQQQQQPQQQQTTFDFKWNTTPVTNFWTFTQKRKKAIFETFTSQQKQ